MHIKYKMIHSKTIQTRNVLSDVLDLAEYLADSIALQSQVAKKKVKLDKNTKELLGFLRN